MKKFLILSMILAGFASAPAQDIAEKRAAVKGKKFETLTIGEQVFEKATVLEIDDLGIKIMHPTGVARVQWKDAPETVRNAWGYDETAYQGATETQKQQHLAQTEKQKQAQWQSTYRKLVKLFDVTYDKFDEVTTYKLISQRDNSTHTNLSLQISVPKQGDPTIWLRPFYRGTDWIFMNHLQFSGIGHEGVSFEGESEVISSRRLHEWGYIEAPDVNLLTKVSQNATGIRFSGKYLKDLPMTNELREQIMHIVFMYSLLAYEG